MSRNVFVWTFVAFVGLTSAVWAAPADQLYEQGNQALSQGDFQQALDAFGKAARADRENPAYSNRYAQLRQILMLRDRLGKETDSRKWQRMAMVLHSFYLNNRLFGDGIALDQKVHERMNNTYSCAMLAQTQMAMGENEAAAATLAPFADKAGDQKWALGSLQAIALARCGKSDDSLQLANSLLFPQKLAGRAAVLVARLKAVLGEPEASLSLLKTGFETTMPSQLETLKKDVANSPDFAALRQTDAFAQVLATKSKMTESGCSGGSSCANCPNRGSCSKSKKTAQ